MHYTIHILVAIILIFSFRTLAKKKSVELDRKQIEGSIETTKKLFVLYNGREMTEEEEKEFIGFVRAAYESDGILGVQDLVDRWQDKIKMRATSLDKRCGRR